MRVIDPGHRYELTALDGDGSPIVLQFVKRIGDHFPGNEPPAAAGTTLQEMWRVAVDLLRVTADRGSYVNGQIPCVETEAAIGLIEAAIVLLEVRAKRVKGKTLDAATVAEVVGAPACPGCGHVFCTEAHDGAPP